MEFDRVPRIAKHLSLIFFVAWLGRSTVWNFLPIFIEEHIASVFLVGIVTSLPAVIPIFLDIPVGNLVQRAGEKIVILLGLLAGVLPPILYFTALPFAIVAGKAVEGVMKSMVWNGGWSISLKTAEEDIESQAVSVFLLGVNLALIVAPIMGGYLIAAHGFNLTFGLWFFTSMLSVLVFLSYIGLEGSRGFFYSLEELFHRKTYRDDWIHIKDNWSNLKLPLSLVFLYSIIFSFYWLAIPLLLEKMGAGFVLMGVIFGVSNMPKAFQFIFGDIADRIGHLKMVAVLAVILTPVLVFMRFVEGVMLLGAMFFVARTLSAGMSPGIHAVFDERVPDELEGEMTGCLELFKHSGTALGPVMAGTVASIWNLNISFLAAALVAVSILGVAGYNLKT